jgi:hypothetical protein
MAGRPAPGAVCRTTPLAGEWQRAEGANRPCRRLGIDPYQFGGEFDVLASLMQVEIDHCQRSEECNEPDHIHRRPCRHRPVRPGLFRPSLRAGIFSTNQLEAKQ